jgi:Cys-rich repeat protein
MLPELRSFVVVCGALLIAGCGGSPDPSSSGKGLKSEGEACVADSDCQSGLACLRGVCVMVPGSDGGTPTPACRSDADCARGEVCQSGSCVPGPTCPGGRGCPTPGCNGSNCPCDIVKQDCASPGDRCYPTSTTSTAGQCYTAGGQGLGSPCTEPPVDVPAACGRGLLCVAPTPDSREATCQAICAADGDCPAGQQCHVNLGGMTTVWGVCVPKPITPPPACDAFTQNCPSTQMCVLTQAGPNECIAAGSGPSGSSCAKPGDCAAGLACAALAGQSGSDYYFSINPTYLSRGGGVCRPLCTTSAPCAAGAVCSFISGPDGSARPDAGVCYVP